MQLFSLYLPESCDLYLASDFHAGSILTHYDGIKGFVERVGSNRKARAIILGDLAEGMTVDDHRFDPQTNDLDLPTPMLQYQKIIELLKPIAKQILYINDGNHDYKLARTINFVKDVVCKELAVPYGTYSSKLSVTDSKGNYRFKVFTTHGYGSVNSTADDPIRRKSNMKLSVKRKLQNKAGDCVLMGMGHSHKLLVSEPNHGLYLVDDASRIKQLYYKSNSDAEYIHPDHRWYCNTGSFLRNQVLGASGYAERFGYDPVELGYIKVSIKDYQIAAVGKEQV